MGYQQVYIDFPTAREYSYSIRETHKTLLQISMNNENRCGLRQGSWGVILTLKDGETVFVPTLKAIANARVLTAFEHGSVTVHYAENYNLEGDFRTELMFFNANLVLDVSDLGRRNIVRVSQGMAPIER